MSTEHDLIVIGAGMAGVTAATKCASQGWDVAIVDALPYGGTCALRGCDPKKILRRGAEILDAARLMRGKGVDQGGLAISWTELMRHKRGFTDPVPDSMEAGLAGAGVATLHGEARFTGADGVQIDGVAHRAQHVLVATGAAPRSLDFPGHELMVDSTRFLDLETLPARILFVGGGFVSFELAHIAARAGSSVLIVDRGTRPLKTFDPDLVQLLLARGAAAGVEVRTSTAVAAVERDGAAFRVLIDHAGRTESIATDLVVHGAGREADLARLDLDAAGVAWSARGVSVLPHLQSSTNPVVYAAGDSADTAGMPLTPVAVAEGKVAASNMLKGGTAVPDYTGVPTVVFTIPELTRVGLLEHEARDQGLNVDVRYSDTSGWYSTYRVAETTAAVKILVDRSSDLIVGAHLLGPGYAELVNTLGLAMKLGLTARQLKSATTAYPTVGSDLASML